MKWSEWLLDCSLDDFLFGPEPDDTAHDLALLGELRSLCSRNLASLKSVRELKAELKSFARSRSVPGRVRGVLDGIEERLAEIADDLRFARSPQGRFILFVNDWAQQLYRIIRPQPRFADAFIGAHRDGAAVVVYGRVPTERALRDLRSLIEAHPPGVEVIWQVAVRRSGWGAC
jgi:hypothetical protein